jgi:hypothetical protein
MGVKTGLSRLKKKSLRVFENRVLRKMSGSKREEMAGDLRRLHSEDLHNLYATPITIRMIKPRKMRWERHVASMREMSNVYKILNGKLEETLRKT